MLNKVQLIGRLGQNPEKRTTVDGKAVCTFSVATPEYFTNKEGERQEKTEWHNIVCFDRLAENCSQFIGKGSLVFVEGKLKTDKWQDKNGQDRYTTKINAQQIKFLDKKSENSSQNNYKDEFSPAYNSFPNNANGIDDFPFGVSEIDEGPF